MEISQQLKQQAKQAQTDPEFIEACQNLNCGLILQIIKPDKNIINIEIIPDGKEAIVIGSDTDIWQEIIKEKPAPGFQSFTAVRRFHGERLHISADQILLSCALHAIERLFEILRNQTIEKTNNNSYIDICSITGHYTEIKTKGTGALQLYYEESGNSNKPKILMLHTAGADSAQFHAIMADNKLQNDWHMLAFDMPAHGRSMPSDASLWQGYHLKKQEYIDICTAFIDAVAQEPVVVLGCSMGAAMALKLARVKAKKIKGVIALEAPYKASGRISTSLANPHINQAAHNPSYVRGLMSPLSPLALRRRAAWIYSRGGFQVYLGDLEFYSNEFDASIDLQGLSANNKIISLLTGAYDYSASPEDSQKVADLIPGSNFVIMKDLGHFPMVENPRLLLEYLYPELDKIRSQTNG